MSFNQLIIQQSPSIQRKLSALDFDLSSWRKRTDSETLAGGRGASQKVKMDDDWYVLREYLRGGLVARLLKDQYVWTGLTRSRPYREDQVVQLAQRHALPVPAVAGYRIQTSGLFYRAAILTRYVDNQGTLASFISDRDLAEENWFALGALIRRLHWSGICHVDLNANNILLTANLDFYLIDFDKAKIMSQQGSWTTHNLQRLLRSLHKIQQSRRQQNQPFHFNSGHWKRLLDGYK
ncbi:MAG: 3-deoxy-D-manno-octulosonic acid kinase [Gammaproteobacteria bacterium]|nr:3-deoxy-D-manno-octulosonic acid kinase [Gammaproteobacteria bacterium]MBL6998867.1 3-deoxy-D-manno-octulosonic acid kinase [Gammaproteobacteria bacterium]